MAFSRMAMARKIAGQSKTCCNMAVKRWTHAIAQPPPLHGAIRQSAVSPSFVLPEFERSIDTIDDDLVSGYYVGGGSMELMAVPKKKGKRLERRPRN